MMMLVNMPTIVEWIGKKFFYQPCCKEFGAKPVCEYERGFILDGFKTIIEKQFATLYIDHHPLLQKLLLCKNHTDTDGFGLLTYKIYPRVSGVLTSITTSMVELTLWHYMGKLKTLAGWC